MPPRIITILDRLRQDLAAELTPDAIRNACLREKYSWRQRVLDPVTTIYLFLLQVLHGNTACQHTVHFGHWNFTDTAYCAARKRLPLRVFHRLMEQITATFRKDTEASATWRGHRVWLIDGSGFSMSDTPELQRTFGQPTNQERGCGFPVAKFLALFDLATGMLLRVQEAPLRSHEMSRCMVATADLSPGDIVVGDRGFCSYAHLAMLRKRGLHAIFRVHQRQIIDFTPGRPHASRSRAKGAAKDATCLPRSRWVQGQGEWDQIVVWYKPKSAPKWMGKEEFEALPEETTVRELRYRIVTPGFRTSEITLVTTLLDATIYPASELADLYYRRWQVEINFRHLKITMKMDVLKCKTVEGVLKELAVFALVYNLVRSVMVESARKQGVAPERISLIDAIRWLTGVEGEGHLFDLLVNPGRKGRFEPRVRKRRPKQYPLMKKPRPDLRKQLVSKEVTP